MKTREMTTARCGLAVLGILLAISAAPVQAGDAGASMNGPSTFPQQEGAALFQAVCQGCHQASAQGAVGAAAYPALARNIKLASAAYPVYTVLQGRKTMPPLASYLSDAQIAAVVNYVRTHFGNDYADTVSPETVKSARETH
jgi:mono/diheme cytochrome c family protein